MSGRYQIRVFESIEKEGATGVDTVLEPTALTFSVYAESAEKAELSLRRDIDKGKRARGRVYQICPPLGHGIIRSIAAALDGSFFHVFMDPAGGPYSHLRRIRLPQAETAVEHASPFLAAQAQ